MSYSSGMLKDRVTVARRLPQSQDGYGIDSSGIRWEIVGDFWAAVDFVKGIKAMREGALDAYETLMIRMRHTDVVDRNCIVRHKGTWYQVESFHDDYQANTIQMTAVEMASQDVTLSH